MHVAVWCAKGATCAWIAWAAVQDRVERAAAPRVGAGWLELVRGELALVGERMTAAAGISRSSPCVGRSALRAVHLHVARCTPPPGLGGMVGLAATVWAACSTLPLRQFLAAAVAGLRPRAHNGLCQGRLGKLGYRRVFASRMHAVRLSVCAQRALCRYGRSLPHVRARIPGTRSGRGRGGGFRLAGAGR
jgi:hypothetical protein